MVRGLVLLNLTLTMANTAFLGTWTITTPWTGLRIAAMALAITATLWVGKLSAEPTVLDRQPLPDRQHLA